MNRQNQSPLTENEIKQLEAALVRAGQVIAYPETRPLAARVRSQLEAEPVSRRGWKGLSLPARTAWGLAAALALALLLLLAWPDARNALAQLLGLPTIRIFLSTPTPTATAAPTSHGTSTAVPSVTPRANALCCETSLDQAQSRLRFKMLLPPSEKPTRVYYQQLDEYGGAQQVVLVFGEPTAPRVTLYEAENWLYGKILYAMGPGQPEGTIIQETTVNGHRALWLTGAPHVLVTLNPEGTPVAGTERPVDANTLAWEEGDVTLRLETKASLEEAIRFAESLH